MTSKKTQASPKSASPRTHPKHEREFHRLNRVIGQLGGVRRMIEEQRYCPDILTQMQAIQSALKALELSILERHLQHCVSAAGVRSKNWS
ncbi:MAG: transcriptional regulator [Bradymonadales bacterium]|nr:MAG: transcriptional regulator [Bradymonadales bacterium]